MASNVHEICWNSAFKWAIHSFGISQSNIFRTLRHKFSQSISTACQRDATATAVWQLAKRPREKRN